MKTSFQILAASVVLASGFAFAQGNAAAPATAPTAAPSATTTTESHTTTTTSAKPSKAAMKAAHKACKEKNLKGKEMKKCVKDELASAPAAR